MKEIFNFVIHIFVSPKVFFTEIRNRSSHWWVPFSLTLFLMPLTHYWFGSYLSPEWVIDQQILMLNDLSVKEEEAIRSLFSSGNPNNIRLLSALSSFGSLLLTLLLLTLYLKLILGEKFGKNSWFSLVLWSGMPTLVHAIGFALLILILNKTNMQLDLSGYASFNQILFRLPLGSNYYMLTEMFSLFTLWSIALMTIGLKQWCDFSTFKASIISSAPYFVVFVLLAAMAIIG
jgi:hypothetical protein